MINYTDKHWLKQWQKHWHEHWQKQWHEHWQKQWQKHWHKRLKQIACRLDACSALIGRKAAWLYLLLVLVVVWDVITRRLLAQGSVKLQELEWHIHAVGFLACLAWAYQRNEHIRVDILRSNITPRSRAKIELLGCIFLLLPWSGLSVIWGWHFVIASFKLGEHSNAPSGLGARWLIKSTLPLAMMLLTMQGWAHVLRLLAFLLPPISKKDSNKKNSSKRDSNKSQLPPSFCDDH